MGMIQMATDVDDHRQYTLGLLDITVRRNAFGAQVHSFEDEVSLPGLDNPVTGVFIRAPVVSRLGEGVSEFRDLRRRHRRRQVRQPAEEPRSTRS